MKTKYVRSPADIALGKKIDHEFRWNTRLSRVIIAALMLLSLWMIARCYSDFQQMKIDTRAEMQANNGLCKSWKCVDYAHDYDLETPQQKAWYHDHITLPDQQRRAEHEAWAKRTCQRLYQQETCGLT